MSFRLKVRQVATTKCPDTGEVEKVLVLARLTEDTFGGKKLGYRVATDCGEVYDVDEADLEKLPSEPAEPEAPAEGEAKSE